MGGSQSSSLPSSDMAYDHHVPQYPLDMNAIFKGIPKMMQVADDMHRMTNYIMDLRNLTYGLVIISAIGCLGFLILRFIHGRNSRRRKRSLREDGHLPRYYYQSQYSGDPWERPKSTFSHHSLDEKKMYDTRNSPEERRPNGHPATYKAYGQVSPPDEHVEDKKEDSFPTHKRSMEPVKLLVEDLPYADTA